MNIETANRLLQYRKQHGLSQEALAEKIGVSRQAISKWERAEASPDTDNLILLADIYGVSLDELLKGENTTEEETETKQTAEPKQSEETATPENDNTYNNKEDRVFFKDGGFHVDSKDGDHVRISFIDGIHVHDKNGSTVDIDGRGIHVNDGKNKKVYTDENGNVVVEDGCKKHHHDGIWYKFPFFLFAIIGFLAWGFSGVCFGWALSWVCFLTIPIYYSLVDAIYKRNPHHFAYPVLTVIAYMFMGIFEIYGGWAFGWIVFLTIPFYYWICSIFKRDND